MISVVFLIELIVVAVSAYPLFSINGNIGIIIWLCLFAITLYTASKIEKFKKSHNIQTYKEILAFIDGKQLTHDETQQEIGKEIIKNHICIHCRYNRTYYMFCCNFCLPAFNKLKGRKNHGILADYDCLYSYGRKLFISRYLVG